MDKLATIVADNNSAVDLYLEGRHTEALLRFRNTLVTLSTLAPRLSATNAATTGQEMTMLASEHADLLDTLATAATDDIVTGDLVKMSMPAIDADAVDNLDPKLLTLYALNACKIYSAVVLRNVSLLYYLKSQGEGESKSRSEYRAKVMFEMCQRVMMS